MVTLQFVTIFLVAFTSNAVRADEVQFLTKGQPAPFAGYLITQEKVDKVHDLSVDLDHERKINLLLQKDADFYVQRLDLYKGQTEDLSKQLAATKDNSFFSKVGFFVLGAALTTGIAFGVSRATR